MSFTIGFKLMELDELLAKSVNPDPKYMDNRENRLKSLYNLSLGEYWFEIEGQTIPEEHPDFLNTYPRQSPVIGIDYLVLQLFDDLEEFLPAMLTPIPRELSEAIENGQWKNWFKALGAADGPDIKQFDASFRSYATTAWRWWHWRKLGFWYLVEPPEIHIWSLDSEKIHVEWDTRAKRIVGVLTMIETGGKTVLPYSEFLKVLTDFRDRLLLDLSSRIQELARRELINDDGKANLLRQAELYRDQFDAALIARVEDDWPATLAAIRRLEPLIGPLF